MRLVVLLTLAAFLVLAVGPIRLEVQSVLVSPVNTTLIVDYVKAAKKAYTLKYRER